MLVRVDAGEKKQKSGPVRVEKTEGNKKSTPMMVETEGKTTVVSAGGTADESAKGPTVKR